MHFLSQFLNYVQRVFYIYMHAFGRYFIPLKMHTVAFTYQFKNIHFSRF